jgi:hypothetical protein
VLEPEESVAAADSLLGLLPELLAAASRVCSAPAPQLQPPPPQQQQRNQHPRHELQRAQLERPEASIRACPEVVPAVAHFFMPGGMLLTLMPDATDQLRSEMLESMLASSAAAVGNAGLPPID